jgi:hypothetical protein
MLVLLLLLSSMFLQIDAHVSPSHIERPSSLWDDLEERAAAEEDNEFTSEEEDDDDEQVSRTPAGPNPASPLVHQAAGIRLRLAGSPLIQEENQDDQNGPNGGGIPGPGRRRRNQDTPVRPLQYHRDDQNGPDGGGVPVN